MVWSVANNRPCANVNLRIHNWLNCHTIFLMAVVLGNRCIVYPSMVECVEVTDLCPERARVFCKRVESESVKSEKQYLIATSQRKDAEMEVTQLYIGKSRRRDC